MIEGILLVNLDPPVIGFITERDSQWRHSSMDELSEFLVAFEVAEPGHRLPLEYQVRLPGEYSAAKLNEFGLFHESAKTH